MRCNHPWCLSTSDVLRSIALIGSSVSVGQVATPKHRRAWNGKIALIPG